MICRNARLPCISSLSLHGRTNQQVLNYLHAENAYAAAVLAPMANLTEELYTEMAGRIPASDVSDPPQRYNGFYYYEYRVPGGQFMVKARCTTCNMHRRQAKLRATVTSGQSRACHHAQNCESCCPQRAEHAVWQHVCRLQRLFREPSLCSSEWLLSLRALGRCSSPVAPFRAIQVCDPTVRAAWHGVCTAF